MQDLTTKLEKYERVLQRALGSRWDTDIDAYLDGQIEVPELDKLRKELAMMKGRLEFATDNAVELANQRDSAKQEVVELRAQVQRMMKEPRCTIAERTLIETLLTRPYANGSFTVAFDAVVTERRYKRNYPT